MQNLIITRRISRIIGAAALVLALGVSVASAQNFPSGGGRGDGFNERDDVTGYLCVTPGCDVVRMSEANCLCIKENPNERRLSKLRLTCSKRENGAWVACPVKPRYGNGEFRSFLPSYHPLRPFGPPPPSRGRSDPTLARLSPIVFR